MRGNWVDATVAPTDNASLRRTFPAVDVTDHQEDIEDFSAVISTTYGLKTSGTIENC